jgi:hypothetical protein
MKKAIIELTSKCNRKPMSEQEITQEVCAIGATYNLFYDLEVFNSRQLFNGKAVGRDFLLDFDSADENLPQIFIYLSYDGTMYLVNTGGYEYMRHVARITV